MVDTVHAGSTIDGRMPQLARVIRHIIKGMKLLPPDPTQDSPTGFRFIWQAGISKLIIFQRFRFKGSTVWRWS